MKKKILCILIFTLAFSFCLSAPGFAELGYESYILQPDSQDYFVGGLEENEELAKEISDKYGLVVSCAVFDSNRGLESGDVTDELYMEKFGGYDGIILSYMYEEGKIYIAAYGRAKDIFSDTELELLLKEFDSQSNIDDCVKYYLLGTENLLSQKYEAGEMESADEMPAVGPEAIPRERQKPRLVDDAGLLSQEEAAELSDVLDEISNRQQLDVAVVTMPDFGGKEPAAFADDFFDYQGYGYGVNDDGILFAIDMTNRKWAISTYGFAVEAFTDYGQQYMTGEFLPYLSDGDYYRAFSEYADLCDELISMAKEGNPMDDAPDREFWKNLIPTSLLLGFGLAFYNASRKKKKLKSVVRHETANNYTREGSMQLNCSNDLFLSRDVSHMKKEREPSRSSGGGGGSSTHTSSSGRSHGGSSGSF